MPNTITAKKDTVLYITNTSKDNVNIVWCPDNTPFVLAGESAISIKVDSAREYLYYLGLQNDVITVSEDEPQDAIVIITAEKGSQLTIRNSKANAVSLPLYPGNSPFLLGSDERLKIEVQSAREYIYYVVTAQLAGLVIVDSTEDDSEDWINVVPYNGVILGKSSNEIQSKLAVLGDGSITGISYYVKDFTEFSSDVSMQSGHYVMLYNEIPSGVTVTMNATGGAVEKGEQTLDDGIMIIRIVNPDKQFITIKATKGQTSTVRTYSLKDLILK